MIDQIYLHIFNFHYAIVEHLFYCYVINITCCYQLSVCGYELWGFYHTDQQLWRGVNPVIYFEYLWNWGGCGGFQNTGTLLKNLNWLPVTVWGLWSCKLTFGGLRVWVNVGILSGLSSAAWKCEEYPEIGFSVGEIRLDFLDGSIIWKVTNESFVFYDVTFKGVQ